MCGVHYFNAADLSAKSLSVATVRPAVRSAERLLAGTADERRTPEEGSLRPSGRVRCPCPPN
jgi:hypothetical protein